MNRWLLKSEYRSICQLSQNTVTCLRTISRRSDNQSVDCVSPSHSVSNLRLIRFGKAKNESPIETDLRLRRIKLQEWNHSYWLKNNREFQKQKSEFISKELKEAKDKEFKSGISYDELALFYKKFLDSNHKKHMNYNLEWYKRHSSLLWPAFKVFLLRLKRHLF